MPSNLLSFGSGLAQGVGQGAQQIAQDRARRKYMTDMLAEQARLRDEEEKAKLRREQEVTDPNARMNPSWLPTVPTPEPSPIERFGARVGRIPGVPSLVSKVPSWVAPKFQSAVRGGGAPVLPGMGAPTTAPASISKPITGEWEGPTSPTTPGSAPTAPPPPLTSLRQQQLNQVREDWEAQEKIRLANAIALGNSQLGNQIAVAKAGQTIVGDNRVAEFAIAEHQNDVNLSGGFTATVGAIATQVRQGKMKPEDAAAAYVMAEEQLRFTNGISSAYKAQLLSEMQQAFVTSGAVTQEQIMAARAIPAKERYSRVGAVAADVGSPFAAVWNYLFSDKQPPLMGGTSPAPTGADPGAARAVYPRSNPNVAPGATRPRHPLPDPGGIDPITGLPLDFNIDPITGLPYPPRRR